MKRDFTISLTKRLALTYALFISLALGALALIVNAFTGLIFTSLVKENIARKSEEIVRTIGDLYNPNSRGFDTVTLETMGMYFVHDGYIISVEDEQGNLVWDARSCDMKECMSVINDISFRMERRFGLNGEMRTDLYPLMYARRNVGAVTIETYGPFFYSEAETEFVTSINKLLFIAGIMLISISIIISIVLSRAIARPILKASEASRRIAQIHGTGTASGDMTGQLFIRIEDHYKTRELAELSRSINELAGELEEWKRRQKQLTSDIAHELRTPLTCLQGNIEAMLDGVYTPDREHLANCHEETIRLANLVQDLNTLTGLEWANITLNKTEFDLAVLLRITAEQWRPAAREKGITINLNLRESVVTADYDRLKQVFVNILSNAVKYTDGGSITITIEEPASSGARGMDCGAKGMDCGVQGEVTVADSGIGIAEEDLPHIFERFYRSDKSRSRSTGGSGIGLAIAAAIVQAHGGTIGAESGGKGTIIRVRV